jgi:hypothetical protein
MVLEKHGRGHGKGLLTQESVGPNPTDRRKKWDQAKSSGRPSWNPAVPGCERTPKA